MGYIWGLRGRVVSGLGSVREVRRRTRRGLKTAITILLTSVLDLYTWATEAQTSDQLAALRLASVSS